MEDIAELKRVLGNDISDNAIEGFAHLQRKLFTPDVDVSNRFADSKSLWRNLDTPAQKESLRKSLEHYNSVVKYDPNARFWIKDLNSVQTKGYRYVTQDTLDLIIANGGSLPAHNGKGWYCSLENYASAADAKNALQLPGQASDYVARIEFDLSRVKNNIRVPFDAQDANKAVYEPLAKAYPDLGAGGGTQVLVDGAGMPVTIHPF